MCKLKSFWYLVQTAWRAYSTRHSRAGCPVEWQHIFFLENVSKLPSSGTRPALNLSAYGTPGAPISFIYAENRDKIVSNRMEFESDGPTFGDKSHNVWSNNLNKIIILFMSEDISILRIDGRWIDADGLLFAVAKTDTRRWRPALRPIHIIKWQMRMRQLPFHRQTDLLWIVLGKLKVLPQHIDYRVVSIRSLQSAVWKMTNTSCCLCEQVRLHWLWQCWCVCVLSKPQVLVCGQAKAFLNLKHFSTCSHHTLFDRIVAHNTTHKRFFLSSSLCPPLCLSFRSIACTRARHRFPIAISPTISSFVRALRNHFGFGLLYGHCIGASFTTASHSLSRESGNACVRLCADVCCTMANTKYAAT